MERVSLERMSDREVVERLEQLLRQERRLTAAVLVHLAKVQHSEWWTESMTAGAATTALRSLKPVVPERFGAYFPA